MSRLSDLRNQIICGSIILKCITQYEDVKKIGYGAVTVAYVHGILWGRGVSVVRTAYIYIYFFFGGGGALRPNAGHGLHILEVF